MKIGGNSRVWILAAAAIIGMLVYFFDPPTSVVGHYPGEIVATYPLGKNRDGYGTVQIRLQGGQTVLSSIPTGPRFPYKNGTRVLVTGFDSFLFHHRSYMAELAPSSAGP